MDLLFIKLKLKNEVQTDDVLDIIEDWLKGSPHYGIKKINYGGESEYNQSFNNSKISIVSQEIRGERIFACRFSHSDADQIWETDCIFNNNDKCFIVRLSCVSTLYSSSLPKIHKPQIIKKLFELDIVDSTSFLQVIDRPIFLENTDESIEKCAKIMNGEIKTELPVVYISYDTYLHDHYYVDPSLLAIKLSGQAHVLVEPCKEFAKSLKDKTSGRNTYFGFLGIYFPGVAFPITISPYSYISERGIDKIKLTESIRITVQQATLNHYSTNEYTWEKLLLEINKKKFLEQKGIAEDSSRELEKYINSFDQENKKLDEEVKRLRLELDMQSRQLETYKRRYEETGSIMLRTDYSEQFYPNEYYDFIVNILELANKKISDDNRGKEIITMLLSNNTSTNTCRDYMNSIKNALFEKSTEKRRNLLERCGFIVEKGSHDKLVFYNPKYTFSLSNSPSDHRESENLFSDISKRIDITRKYF